MHPRALSGPVHINPFSNENGAVLLQIRLSSTLQRRKRSPKTEPSKTLPRNDAFWKRCFLVWTKKTMLSENGDVIKINTTGASPLDRDYPKWRTDATMWLQFRFNFAGQYIEMRMRQVHLNVRAEGLKAFSNRCGVVVWTGENDRKRHVWTQIFLKTEQNSSVFVWKRITVDGASEERFRMAPFSVIVFGVLVWTIAVWRRISMANFSYLHSEWDLSYNF